MYTYNGIMLCDKPYGISSHDVVDRIRRIFRIKKVGHTGTLDPLATGLMVICVGTATKISQFISDVDKGYEAEIKLGQKSATFDAEGIDPNTPSKPVPELTINELESILSKFIGETRQKIPVFSAKKVKGKRLYKLARHGSEIETPERNINIRNIRLISYKSPCLKIEIICSKGTYIRSLANDIGEIIGCGAYLSGLKRTKVGKFELQDAKSLEEFEQYQIRGDLGHLVRPIEEALPFPSIRLNDDFSPSIITGKLPRPNNIVDIVGKFESQELISLCNSEGRIMAIGRAVIGSSELNKSMGQSFFTYVRVLN